MLTLVWAIDTGGSVPFILLLIAALTGAGTTYLSTRVIKPIGCEDLGRSVMRGLQGSGYHLAGGAPIQAGQLLVFGNPNTADLRLVAFTWGDLVGELSKNGFEDVGACTTDDDGRAHVLTKTVPLPADRADAAPQPEEKTAEGK